MTAGFSIVLTMTKDVLVPLLDGSRGFDFIVEIIDVMVDFEHKLVIASGLRISFDCPFVD